MSKPPYASLGALAHRKAHELLVLSQDDSDDGLDVSGSNWLALLGNYDQRSQLYPREKQMNALERRERKAQELRRLLDAVEALRRFDSVLFRAIWRVCLNGEIRFAANNGVRHLQAYERVMSFYGSEAAMWRALEKAWELIGLVWLDKETVHLAINKGAVNRGALEWVKREVWGKKAL
ncbi:MAG TPA: hypothetical protein VNL15_06025 [Dehalococcoidia bacterium]|nr:hypothetical protein [Dehalococcoidia bacterium]